MEINIISKQFVVLFLIILFISANALAIEFNPTKEQINKAIQDGKDANAKEGRDDQEGPDNYFDFGVTEAASTYGFLSKKTDPSCGRGAINTKLRSIKDRSKEAARKMQPTPDMNDLLQNETLQIIYVYCQLSPKSYDDKTHLVLKQGDKIIQPTDVASSAGLVLSAWFSYGSFDPRVSTNIIIIPNTGKRVEYIVDFSAIP